MNDSIARLIPFGKKNAISRKILTAKCVDAGLLKSRFKDADRGMRRLIAEARFAGTPILYSEDGSGYYRPTKEETAELRAFVKAEERRAKAIFGSLKSAKEQLKDYEYGEDVEMAVNNDYSIKAKVKNVPDYAWEKAVWVVRFCEDGNFWFYGAWLPSEMEKAADVARMVSGIVITGE